MKALLRYFLRGCLALLPVATTLYIAFFIVATIDRWVPVGIPGLGFALALLVITLVGFLTSNVVGRAVLDTTDRILTRLPLAKLVYTSIRDLVGAFVGEKKRFDRPVAVTLMPGSNIRTLGFITRDRVEALGIRDCVAVYFPQSLNFAGYLAIVPRDQVEPLPASPADLMTFIVSGGISGLGIEPAPVSRSGSPDKPGGTLLGIGPRKRDE
jgi:uncharacterized membrane protein